MSGLKVTAMVSATPALTSASDIRPANATTPYPERTKKPNKRRVIQAHASHPPRPQEREEMRLAAIRKRMAERAARNQNPR